MRFIVGGAAVVLGCASVFAADGAAPARDYVAERAALVATVIPPSEGARQGWESLESAIRAMALSQQRITQSLWLQYGLEEGTRIDLNPLLLIDAPPEADDAAPLAAPNDEDPKEDTAPAEGEGGEAEAGDEATDVPAAPDMEKIALQGVRSLMRTYDGNRVHDRLTTLRLQPQVFIPLDDTPLMMRDFSYAEGLRALARLEAVRMWRFLEEEEDKKAADSFEALLALAVVMSREPTIMGRIQSIAVIGITTQTLERWMLDHRIDGDLARDLLRRLDRHSARLTPMTYTLDGERLTGLDTIARVFSREIPAPMVMPEGEAGSLKSQEENEKRLNELYDAMAAWTREPAHVRREADPSPAALADAMPTGLVLVKILAPGLEQGVWMWEGGRANLDGLRLMLALEASREAGETYPESLDALVPAVLKELPRDGFAPDGRYRYRRVDDGVARAGTGYVLYSVGYDATDDGGTPPENVHPLLALRPSDAGRGTDFVINRRAPE